MKFVFHINVVESFNFGQPHAPKIDKQVDSDQGWELSPRAIVSLVINLILKAKEIFSDKV
jgi:hypothetical protein